jgi:hypothetical protein
MLRKTLTGLALVLAALIAPNAAQAAYTSIDLNATTSPRDSVFYPYIHDGYKDQIMVNYRGEVDLPDADISNYLDCWNSTTSEIRVTIQSVVRNHAGNIIRHLPARTTSTWDTYSYYDGTAVDIDVSVAWDGRKDNGTRVDSGYFNITGQAQLFCLGDPQDLTAQVRVGHIHPTTGYLTKTKTLRKTGRGAYSHSGTNSRPDGWSWWLDSMFGSTDTVTYRFAVPSSGFNIRGGIYAPYHQGPFYVKRWRSGGYVYEKVTAGQGAYGDVDSAHVSFSKRVRI